MRVDLLTREYPPDVYGGAGVHVEYLARSLRALADVRVHCFGQRRTPPFDDPGVTAYLDPPGLAGANPALWRDILLSNREALSEELEACIASLRRVLDEVLHGDADGLQRWIEDARADRQRLRDAEVAAGPVTEVRVTVPNRPGIVAQLALAVGEAGVNIIDMALYPAADMQSGAIGLWVAGEGSADRVVELIDGLGYPASVIDAGEPA